MVLRSNLYASTALNKDNCGIRYVQRCNSRTNKVITAWAVDKIQLLTIPLCMEDSREYRIAVLLLYRKIITNSVLLGNTTPSFDNACLEKQSLCQGCLTRTIIAHQRNVFNLICFVNFHII